MDALDPEMIPIYRRMSAAERIEAGFAATEMLRDRLRAHFGFLHPEWDDRRIERAVAERILEAHETE